MTIQYIIVGIIIAVCVVLAGRWAYREWRENVRYRNYGCAGCPFYEKCTRKASPAPSEGGEMKKCFVEREASKH